MHLFRIATLTVTFLSLFCLSACTNSENSASGATSWSTDNQGWLLMKNEKNLEERFFAIGTWHVPGYTFTKEAHADSLDCLQNAQLFRERTSPFNMVFVTSGLEKDYMSEKIHVMNPFSPMLHAYLDRFVTLPKGDDKDYYRSQFLKSEVNNPAFVQYLDSQILTLLDKRTNDKYIFSHIDEIALGGVSKWAVPPAVGSLITQRLKEHDPDALVYVDLLGHAKGSTHLFEQRYLKTNEKMPEDPPYDLLSKEARECKLPLLGFYQAYDGTPVYQFKKGNYSYSNYDFESLKRIWYENTKIIAGDYSGNGDVFGINAFRDFYAHPVLAGLTVDALRAGLGEKVPLWLYFDGNGYAKPGNVTPEQYLVNVKCQIYTAIIHGATGILFWNDWSKIPEVFDELLPVMEELNDNLEIIKLNTVERVIEGDKHIVIKGNNKEKYIIASNTSKTDTITIEPQKGIALKLAPLETIVTNLK
ncbi:MAG: hypothetical protein ITG04_01640 [Proteiniphilum sp.]|nr:hypothetical protein [Proteiniphilum sp.]